MFILRSSSFHYKRLIFADISPWSEFGETEQEVLFAAGSYFQISGKWFDPSENLWNVELEEMYIRTNQADLDRYDHHGILSHGHR